MKISAINIKYNNNFKTSFAKQLPEFEREKPFQTNPFGFDNDEFYSNAMKALIYADKFRPLSKFSFINSNGYVLNESKPKEFLETTMKLGCENITKKVSKLGETRDNFVLESESGDYYCVDKCSFRIISQIEINKENPNDSKLRFYDNFGNVEKEFSVDENDMPDDDSIMNIFANSNLVFDFLRELGVDEDSNVQRALDLDFFDSLVQIAKKGEAKLDVFRAYNTVANKHMALRDQQISKFMYDLKNAYFKNLSTDNPYINDLGRISSFNETFSNIDDGLFFGDRQNLYFKKENYYEYLTGARKGEIVSSNELRQDLIYGLNHFLPSDDKEKTRFELRKIGLIPLMNDRYIVGLDGIINPQAINSSNNPFIKSEFENFYGAKIVLPSADRKTKRFVEGIFASFPEIESLKGKKQPHHKGTVDAEIINSLSHLMNNSDFSKLDNSLKKSLILCMVLEDLSSDECGKNFNHPKTSYTYAKNILENIKKNGGDITDDEINLTTKLIYYHDWFDYSIAKDTNNPPIKVNTLLGYMISKDSKLPINGRNLSGEEVSKLLNIVAETNLLGSDEKTKAKFENYKNEYQENFKEEYEKAKYFTLRQSNVDYDFSENSKIFEKTNIDGKEIYVVKDENLPISVHMTRDLETMYNLACANYTDIQSCSILTSKSSGTVWGLNYGFLISYDKENVVLEASKDLDSGYNKNIYMSKIFLYPEKILHTMSKALMYELEEQMEKQNKTQVKKAIDFLNSSHFNSLSTDKKTIVVGKFLERFGCSNLNASRAMESEIDERNRNQNEMLVNDLHIESVVIKGTKAGIEEDIKQAEEAIKFAQDKNLKIVYLPDKTPEV